MEIISDSLKQTKQAGEILATEALKAKRETALVIGLKGDLGGGKTSFAQGFAKGLGIVERVLSPTFSIFKAFPIKKKGHFKKFYHFDCYRIKKSEEMLALGFNEIISDRKNIVLVEWPENIIEVIPEDAVMAEFEVLNENQRKISFKSG